MCVKAVSKSGDPPSWLTIRFKNVQSFPYFGSVDLLFFGIKGRVFQYLESFEEAHDTDSGSKRLRFDGRTAIWLVVPGIVDSRRSDMRGHFIGGKRHEQMLGLFKRVARTVKPGLFIVWV